MSESRSGRRRLLTFGTGGECYAFPGLRVREILQVAHISPVPGSPPSVLGVINLRGRVVPVVDLGANMGLAASIIGRMSVIVVLLPGEDDAPVGVLVDEVFEVIEVSAEDMSLPPEIVAMVAPGRLAAVVRRQESVVFVLSAEALSLDLVS